MVLIMINNYIYLFTEVQVWIANTAARCSMESLEPRAYKGEEGMHVPRHLVKFKPRLKIVKTSVCTMLSGQLMLL